MAGEALGLGAQAAQFVRLMHALMREVFSLDPEDPTTDLPVAQLRVCALLGDGPRTVSSLAGKLGISVSAATQVADRLESAGLAERVVEDDDRRIRTLRLTRRGSAFARGRREKRVRSARKLLAMMAPVERRAVLSALQTLVDVARGASR